MAVIDVPPWITVQRGRAPILLLAPHGGRRHDPRHPGRHKVNDLHTADVTRALAAVCDGSVIINERLDRNELDLNRLSQVRRDAPWLLALLEEILAAMVAEAGKATVLVVHGWNVTQPACDVGVGLRERSEGLVAVRPNTPTVSADFVARRLRPLQHAAAAEGIAVTIGARYPAAHPNNLLELFRIVADRDARDRSPIAALCGRGVVEAAQLELAIPLRWPGRWRDRFLALLGTAFGEPCSPAVTGEEPRAGAAMRAAGGRVTRRRGLQFMAGDTVVMTSIDAGEAGAVAGRLMISSDADHLALFTGELSHRDAAWSVPPLAYHERADGLRVTYEGPLLCFPMLTPFLDLERGLAAGTLIEARADLTFDPDDPTGAREARETFGTVTGALVVAGNEHRVDTRAVSSTTEAWGHGVLPALRVTLPGSPWGPIALAGDPDDPLELREGGRLVGALIGSARPGREPTPVRAACDLRLGATAGTLDLRFEGEAGRSLRLTGTLERLIPVRRPGRDEMVIDTTYAIVRFGADYVGWVEVTVAGRGYRSVSLSSTAGITEW